MDNVDNKVNLEKLNVDFNIYRANRDPQIHQGK